MNRRLRKSVSRTKLQIISLVVVLLAIYKYVSYKNDFGSLIAEIRSQNLKSVQLITGRFTWKDWGVGGGLGQNPFRNCAEKRCYAYRSFLVQTPHEQSDGVMVHGPNLWYLPSRRAYKRNRKQLWLYFTMEPPMLSKCSAFYGLKDMDDLFNLTVTFRSDSNTVTDYRPFRHFDQIAYQADYVDEYVRVRAQKRNSTTQSIDNFLQEQKSAFYLKRSSESSSYVAWFVSHCETSSRREDYVTQMLKHVRVDVLGSCASKFGENAAKDPCRGSHPYADMCFNRLLNSYKFYLSFENSLCDDYISEKFWKFFSPSALFSIHVVLVVRGARSDQYRREAPAHSYIDASAYSPKELALYLKYLNENSTAYLEYFAWKLKLYERFEQNVANTSGMLADRSNDAPDKSMAPFCTMCAYLHNESYMSSVSNRVWKLSEWFSGRNNCWGYDESRSLFSLFSLAQYIGVCI